MIVIVGPQQVVMLIFHCWRGVRGRGGRLLRYPRQTPHTVGHEVPDQTSYTMLDLSPQSSQRTASPIQGIEFVSSEAHSAMHAHAHESYCTATLTLRGSSQDDGRTHPYLSRWAQGEPRGERDGHRTNGVANNELDCRSQERLALIKERAATFTSGRRGHDDGSDSRTEAGRNAKSKCSSRRDSYVRRSNIGPNSDASTRKEQVR